MAFLEGGQHILAIAADNTSRTWMIDVGALRRGLGAANADCLPSDMRAIYLGESRDDARERHAACERAHRRTPVVMGGAAPGEASGQGKPSNQDKPDASGPAGGQPPELVTLGSGERRVAVFVIPGDASVEVDGQLARRRNGAIEIVRAR